jgi:hypothetical protein
MKGHLSDGLLQITTSALAFGDREEVLKKVPARSIPEHRYLRLSADQISSVTPC